MTSQNTADLPALVALFEQDRNNPATVSDISGLLILAGRFNTRVEPVYQRASALRPSDQRFSEALNLTVFLRNLRRYTIDMGEPDIIDFDGLRDTTALIQEYLRAYPASPDLFFSLGDLHILRGNVLLAIGAYENALRFGFEEVRLILKSFEFANRSHSFQPSERAYFAALYKKSGDHYKALEIFRSVVADGFHDLEIVHSLIGILEQQIPLESNQNLFNQLVMEVTELRLLLGEDDSALASFARVKFPINQGLALVRRIAELLIRRGDYRLAFDYLSKLPMDDDTKGLINRITLELEQAGEYDAAAYLLKFINENDLVIREASALRERELEIQTELGLADLNFSTRRYDQAVTNYVQVLRLGYKDDVQILSRIVELLPLLKQDHVENLLYVGQHYLQKQDYYRSAQFFDLVLARRHDDATARNRLRWIYDKLLDRNPNLPELRLRSGDLYMDEGRLEEAVVEYKHASQFPETSIEATRRLAISHMKRRDFTAALECFQAIPIQDLDLENLYELHLIMFNQDSYAEALGLLRMIAEIDDSYRDVQARIEMIKERFAQESIVRNIDPKMKDLIGDIAGGRYRYIEKIGGGGMGIVHKVMDLKLNRVVAMKILRDGLAQSPKAVERFFREARIAATLNHMNIVVIHDYNINNSTSYIAMEYVEGLSVRDLFEQYFTNSQTTIQTRMMDSLFYMAQVCDALHVTHSKGIIHRDIKPDNILIGLDHIAKLTDFGIVHVEEATFTPAGAVIGTPRYMSPEQVQGRRIDGRADLYSAGIILYEWIAGIPPFITGDIAYQQVNMPAVPLTDHNPDIPRDLGDAVMKCIMKEPADRFQTARDLRDCLDTLLRRHFPQGHPYAGRIPMRKPESDMDTAY
jgi:tetratricopeptide (TPR) repeat protein